MEGTPNCKEQNRETNHTNQTLKATKKIVSKEILPVFSLETKVGRFGYPLHEEGGVRGVRIPQYRTW